MTDWNELDFVKLVGSTTIRAGVLHAPALAENRALVRYFPDTHYHGSDSFEFAACDCAYKMSRCSDSAPVHVSVVPLNDKPVALNSTVVIACERGSRAPVTLRATDWDGENDTLAYTVVQIPPQSYLRDDEQLIDLSPSSVSSPVLTFEISDTTAFEDAYFTIAFTVSDLQGETSAVGTVQIECSTFTCSGGMYYDAQSGSCAQCPRGTAESISGMRFECLSCEEGTYAPSPGMVGCLPCDVGTFASESGSSRCIACPSHSQCNPKGIYRIEAGYWRSQNSSYNMLTCRYGTACPGGRSSGNALCAVGFEGPRCAVCSQQYTVDSVAGCKHCSGNELPSILGCTFVAVCGLVGLLLFAMFGSKKYKDRVRTTRRKLLTFVDTSKLKILWVTYQIICSMSWSLETIFPEPFQTFSRIMSFTQLSLAQLLPMGCMVQYNHFKNLVVTTLAPLFACAMIAVACVVRIAMQQQASRSKTYSLDTTNIVREKAVKANHMFCLLLVLFLVLPSAATVALRTFACEEFDGSGSYLYADLSIKCYTPRHNAFMAFATIQIFIWPIGVPSLYATLLATSRHQINPRTETLWTALKVRRANEDLKPIEFLFSQYK